MTFEDEKFLGSWGAIFWSYLVLANFDLVPNFIWAEFLAVETVLGLFGMFLFRKSMRPSIRFYGWGLFLSSVLFVVYSSFALLLLGSAFGEAWLWLLIPLWVLLTVALIRSTVHLTDGVSSPNTALMSGMAAAGASFSGVLTFYVSKATFSFVLAVAMDILLSFVMAAYFIVWLRRYLKLSQRKLTVTEKAN